MAAVTIGAGCDLIEINANIVAGGGTSDNDLIGIIAQADVAGLNGTYGADPITSMAEFQGYDHPSGATVLAYTISIPISTYISACGALAKTIKYKTGTQDVVSNGDVFYNESGGTTKYDGTALWFRSLLEDLAFIIGTGTEQGEVSNITVCK